MATIERTRFIMGSMHSRTMVLAKDAIAAGDEFLAYLYMVALKHIEEMANVEHGPRA